ncbi:MAG: translocation/assembly module TamB domain-containing protein [Pseudobdellovibrionaceae bacterium]
MKRVFWILVTPLAGLFIVWFTYTKWISPVIENWALEKATAYVNSNLPLKFHADHLHINFFKPFISVQGIQVEPTSEITEITKKVQIQEVQVFIDFFRLFNGRLTLSAILINAPQLELNIDSLLKSQGPPTELPMDVLFSLLEKLPLQRVFLKNIELKVNSKKLRFSSELLNGDFLISNQGTSLIAKASLPALKFNFVDAGEFYGSFDTHLYLTHQFLRIIQLGARLDDSELFAHGEITRINQLLIKPSGFINSSAKLNLGDFYKELKKSRPQLKFPVLFGELNAESEARFDGFENVTAKADITTKALMVDKFQLGDAHIQGNYKDRTITLSEMKIQHPAGEASLSHTQMVLDKNYDFKAKVFINDLELQKLFQSLNLNGIPVGVDLKGELPCEGQINPSFKLTCSNATIKGKDLWVKSENHPKGTNILNIDNISAQGQVQITPQSVSYKAAVNIGSSAGTTDGMIDFNRGFKINFKTKKLNFKDVKNLSGLKFQGSAILDGSTAGDSQAAIFDMNLNARDFIFEGFALGNVITELKYRKGRLLFNNIAGALNKTHYLGDLEVNLNQGTFQGDIHSPTVDIADVAIILQNLVKFPVEVQGLGTAKAHLDGPLNFWKMNYQVESAFKTVHIGPEVFDKLNFNVSARNGNLQTDNVLLKRGNGTLSLQGKISSDQEMNLFADGKNWRLEESTIMSKVNSNILGNLNFTTEIKDSVKKPLLLIKGAITDTSLEDQEIPNSNFIFRLNREVFGGQISLFGDKVQGEFQLPFEKKRDPFILKLKTRDWNYASLLGIIGGSNLASEYSSALTSVVDLKSESGELLKSTGKMVIQNLALKRGPLSFENRGPIEIVADDGIVSIKNFRLEGAKNSLQIRGEHFSAQRLNLAIKLQADMRLLHIFLPFLEDLGGPVNMSTTITGNITKPEILGTLNADNTFIKIKNFPHPIERLSTEVLFSQSKILVNNLKGQIAGGSLSGEGSTIINAVKDLPTSLRLHLEGVTFNVPDKVRSSGQADLVFSGNWFPFTLSGTYHVSSALVEKEFTEDGGAAGIKQSIYLPKLIREGQFEPLLLDLQIMLDKNILVKNSLLDGSVSGHLQVKGPPGNPILLGKINTEKKSKLIFKDKIFEIQNGVIDFNDPNEVNPNLYITAQSRINNYDITLLAQGPSKNVGIRLTSVPPLPEQDIISLIALGMTTSNLNSAMTPQNIQIRQQAEQQLGVEIGGAVLAKPISKITESTIGFNLQVTSQYDSTRNISVPKITLSRRLTDRMKVSGSRPVGTSQSYDLKVEYLLNNNITAVGSFESRGIDDTSNTLQKIQPETQSIFGLDLEFKREFK